MARGSSKLVKTSTKVPKPRAKAAQSGIFANVAAPRAPGLIKRVYTKEVLRDDPLNFAGVGFGQTGLTGRS